MQLTLETPSQEGTLALPAELLAHLQAKAGDALVVTYNNDQITLRTLSSAVKRQMTVAQDIMQRYQHTLSELAK